MKEKTKKEKQGHARLFELAGARKNKLTLACLLSVLSSAARIVPFFTIYGVVVELLAHYTAPAEADQGKILALCAITFGAALVYGVCAYASSAISHTAAYEIIYELRLQLMEKLSRISSGYFTGTTQGAIKKIVSDDSDQIEAFLAHHLCEIAAAIATPVFTLLYLFFMDWRLALVTLLPICISLWMLSSCLRQPDKAALQAELHDAQERMQGTVVEYIHGMSVVKVFNRTLSAFRRYEGDLNHFTDVVERTARANARPMGAYYAFFGAQLLFLLPAALLLIPTADSYLDFLPVILLFFLVGRRIEGAAGKHDADGDPLQPHPGGRPPHGQHPPSAGAGSGGNRKSNCLRCGIFQCGVCLYQRHPGGGSCLFPSPPRNGDRVGRPLRRREVHSRPASSALL